MASAKADNAAEEALAAAQEQQRQLAAAQERQGPVTRSQRRQQLPSPAVADESQRPTGSATQQRLSPKHKRSRCKKAAASRAAVAVGEAAGPSNQTALLLPSVRRRVLSLQVMLFLPKAVVGLQILAQLPSCCCASLVAKCHPAPVCRKRTCAPWTRASCRRSSVPEPLM